jgi:heme/copper-type cytochrome/quinol oxidase subunit 2
MSDQVVLALTAVTVLVLVLFTVAAFKYVSEALHDDEEEPEAEPNQPVA